MSLRHDDCPVGASVRSTADTAVAASAPVHPPMVLPVAAGEQGWGAPGCGSGEERVARAGEGLAAGLAGVEELCGSGPAGLEEEALVGLLDTLTAAGDRLHALTALVAARVDARRIPEASGDRSTITWWARRSRMTRGEAGRRLGLGHHLATRLYAPVAAGLAAGRLRTEQAQVVIAAVEALPERIEGQRLDPALRSAAVEALLGHAGDLDARGLRILGKRILDILAPDLAQSHEQRMLEAEEAAAVAAAAFTMVDDGHGRCHGRFTLPSLHGSMLAAQLHALANPRRHPRPRPADVPDGADRAEGAVSPGAVRGGMPGPVITPQVLGQALMSYVESYPTDRLPEAGGVAATVTVTMDLTTLLEGLGVATLDDGTRISAGEARRLACQAGLVPLVLGSASVPLDLGRTSRLARPGQRRALIVRDGGCTVTGCGLPASVCHAHHDEPWSAGGPTDLANVRLLCPRHHRLAHDRRYEMRRAPDNTITFHRRT